MSCSEAVLEFRHAWLPHVSDDGLARVTELLEKASPLLIHGAFTKAMPMGCLATHIAWNHNRTQHLQYDAGVIWLSKIAKLNPATSHLILAWDQAGRNNFELRTALLAECQAERSRRDKVFEPELEEAVC
jgi:hypothetical protein